MISPARGTLLIANPFLKDPNFIRSVIFLCEHKEEGSFGFVLNKKFPKTLGELIPVKCFLSNPSIKSSLTFLRKTDWARKKVEELYIKTLPKFPN